MAKLGFGKYKDLDLRDVPRDYLQWLITNSEEKIKLYNNELARRDAAEDRDASWELRVIKAGFRELAKRHHPDTGGTNEDMMRLNNAMSVLQDLIKDEEPPF